MFGNTGDGLVNLHLLRRNNGASDQWVVGSMMRRTNGASEY